MKRDENYQAPHGVYMVEGRRSLLDQDRHSMASQKRQGIQHPPQQLATHGRLVIREPKAAKGDAEVGQ
ncbi:hypothetical protein [Bradyrhizobium sp. B117]|uniref:hypothetical protein n=1 Tax=Bradyrhizobium sp. B117 TaxID=3140246 RepID=UPI00318438A6